MTTNTVEDKTVKGDFGTILDNAAIVLDECIERSRLLFDKLNNAIDDSVVFSCNTRESFIRDGALIQMAIRISDLEKELAGLRK